MNSRPHIIIGAGGHSKVLLALARASGLSVEGVCAPELADQRGSLWRGVKVLGGDDALDMLDPEQVLLIHGVGQLPRNFVRQRIHDRLKAKGFKFATLVHPYTWIDETVVLGEGVQIMAGAIIQPDVTIGAGTIINTGASVDHDCRVGAHVHVGPGAVLCGNVAVQEEVFIATGCTVLPGLTVARGAIVGAGTTLVQDLAKHQCVIGPTARLR
ncbi:acetyltransferase [Pseudomonas sp. H9]|uniref:acetyltransferase n=1 Tax=Pseudomonas sp. H9 TaxID=483968 RepID=UPI001C49B1E1|nr:acetyltransferase [Pseudomonas sp. H9]